MCRCAGVGSQAGFVPISRPQADAVLHLPSQPSGSQHAAHPHGPPRQGPASSHEIPIETMQQPGQSSAAADGSAFAQQLLDDVLGHDDTDSIWPPPASLPDSQSSIQEPQAKAPDALPASGAVSMPLMPSATGQLAATAPVASLGPNAMAGPQLGSTGQLVNAQQQEIKAGSGLVDDSDGSVTQDSEDEQKSKGEVKQTSRGKGAAAGQGMLTGAYAFPESCMEASQPAASTTRGKCAAASRAGKVGVAGIANQSGKAGAGSKAGAAGKAVADTTGPTETSDPAGKAWAAGKADSTSTASKEGSVTGSGISAVAAKAGRAVPSSWKTRKAAPVTDAADDAAAPGTLLQLLHALLYFTIIPQQQLNPCLHSCSPRLLQ